MQATNFANRNDGAELRRLARPSVGGILVEREVSAGPVIVGEICGEDASQMPLAETTTWSKHSRRIEPMSRSA